MIDQYNEIPFNIEINSNIYNFNNEFDLLSFLLFKFFIPIFIIITIIIILIFFLSYNKTLFKKKS